MTDSTPKGTKRGRQVPSIGAANAEIIEAELVSESFSDVFAGAPEKYADYIAEKVVQRQELQEKRKKLPSITLGALFRIYLEEYAKPHPKTSKDMESCFKWNLAEFEDRDAHLIAKVEIQRWHSEIGLEVGKTTANRALELLSMLYNKGIEWDLVKHNPASKIRKFKLKSRERFLQSDEFPRFFAAVNSLRYEVARDFFLMCLFTGQRRGNILAMRWNEVDLSRGAWHIPETKNDTSTKPSSFGCVHWH